MTCDLHRPAEPLEEPGRRVRPGARGAVRPAAPGPLHRLAAVAAVAGVVLAAGVAGPAAAPAPAAWVPDAIAPDVLTLSAWGRRNGVVASSCTGTGVARRSAGRVEHGGFRCRVQGRRAGVVLVQALGPQWLGVTRVVQGTLAPDAGIGPVPVVPPVLEPFWAGSRVEDTGWARAHGVDTVFCHGVGPAEEIAPSQYLFGAYSCATFARRVRGPQLLVVAEREDVVRIVRQIAP